MTSSLNDLDNKVVVLDSAILPDSEECLIEEELLKPYAQLSQVFVRSDQEITVSYTHLTLPTIYSV